MTVWGGITELLGEDFGDIEFLGRGSSGSVYRATQHSLGRTVAIKVFPQFAGDNSERVLAEAKAQAALSWHGNVLALHGKGTTAEGSPYLVLEYAPHGSLADRVAATGPLSEAGWRRVGSELASALTESHEHGIVHCDVKPSNVLFAADGSVRLADFGIARATDTGTGTLDSLEGSLGYVAPEVLDGARPAPASDVYGLALTLLFAATGEPPIDPDLPLAAAVARISAGDIDQCGFGLPRGSALGDALRRSSEVSPIRRPTAGELARVLRDSRPAMSPGGPPPSERWRPAGGYRAWGFGLLVLALLSTVMFASGGWGADESQDEFDICNSYESYVDDRRELMTQVSADLEQSGSPTEVIERLLVTYPKEFADINQPFLTRVVDTGSDAGTVTRSQLAALAQAETLRSLNGGKPFLYDGEGGRFDATALPDDLQRPAWMFSEANQLGGESCPDVSLDLVDVRARMHSAIFANLADSQFMARFFADPASLDLFDTSTVLLLFRISWDFMIALLDGHGDWFFRLLEREPDLREAVAAQQPEVLFSTVSREPELLPILQDAQWKDVLASSYAQASPAVRSGIWTLYEDEARAVGIPEP